MKVLISPISIEEAQAVYDGGADIIDIKNVKEGSLGASFPWVIRGIVNSIKGSNITFSATLGDLPYKPGTASQAALGAAVSGARYIKAGLYGVNGYQQAYEVMAAVRRTCHDYDASIIVVAAGYADYRRFGGLDPQTLVRVAKDAECNLVMVDTAIKDGKTLFDAMGEEEIAQFVESAHKAGLQVALAGSVKREHLPAIRRSGADVVGIRGAVCRGSDRTTSIDADLVRGFMEEARRQKAAA
jgi:uncharacterized protein (UPF0264 family)